MANFHENTNFKDTMAKFTQAAFTFLMLQMREIGKKKMGHKFTEDEKVLSLMIYKQGPKCYRWLRKIFVLPSPLTLSRMISTANLKPGLNENLFQELEKRVKKFTAIDKNCILIFDEMSISTHFSYSSKSDRITGFVDSGDYQIKKIADHVLVFMIRGIKTNYKQAVWYSFCSGSTPAQELARQIKIIIAKLQAIGLNVVATVCDQGTSNVSAINSLIDQTRQEYLRRNESEFTQNVFKVGGKEVVPLYDPPHLIKGIRNNLLTKNLKYNINGTTKVAKWEHIQMLYNEDPGYQGLRLVPKLTEHHVNPTKIKKMKVKCATQVFSKTVAVTMGYLAKRGILPNECQDTADVLLLFDDLFDSFNGSYNKKKLAKPLLQALKDKSEHCKTWQKSKLVLRSMKFVSINGKEGTVPSIKNWLFTIQNMEYLKKKLFSPEINFTSIWMRRFNQDPLENFFGCVRSHGLRNVNPSCADFETAFAAILLNEVNLSHSKGANCEEDKCYIFKSLKSLFFQKKQNVVNDPVEFDFDHISEEIKIPFDVKKNNPKVLAQIEYVAGYILKRLKSKVIKACTLCNDCLSDKNTISEYLMAREYCRGKRWLCYATPQLLECFSNIQDYVIRILEEKSNTDNIKKYIITVLSVVIDYNFIKCEIHKAEIIKSVQNIATSMFIKHWCKNTNQLLKGIRTDFNKNDGVQIMALEYFNKRRK